MLCQRRSYSTEQTEKVFKISKVTFKMSKIGGFLRYSGDYFPARENGTTSLPVVTDAGAARLFSQAPQHKVDNTNMSSFFSEGIRPNT